MNLPIFLLITFSSIGLSHVIVDSKIWEVIITNQIKSIKNKLVNYNFYFSKIFVNFLDGILYMMNCYQCSGFYSGFICSYIISQGLIVSVLFGFMTSFLSMLFAVIMIYLNGQSEKN